jgi:peptidyl-prolyl cis-trans isomerase C
VIEKLKKLAREPLVHFLLIGAGIYGLYGIYVGVEHSDNERTVTVSADDIQALANQWTRLWSRSPTEEELAGVVRDHVRTQILFREAVAMGLDVGDTVIERRLAQKVELLARGLITPAEPTDEVLQAWYEDNPDRFKHPDLYTITHIFFDPDKREEVTLDDAEVALANLNALDELPANYSEYGDRFMLQSYYSMRSELELRKMFGTGFVEQIVRLEPGRWHGPVLSGYGTHLVMINEIMLAPQPAYDDIKERLKEEWMAGQIDEMSERFVDELISRYEILVEETEVPVTVRGAGAAQ